MLPRGCTWQVLAIHHGSNRPGPATAGLKLLRAEALGAPSDYLLALAEQRAKRAGDVAAGVAERAC